MSLHLAHILNLGHLCLIIRWKEFYHNNPPASFFTWFSHLVSLKYSISLKKIENVTSDCTQSPIFSWGETWSVNASDTRESAQCPWVGVVEGVVGENPHATLLTPPPLPRAFCTLLSFAHIKRPRMRLVEFNERHPVRSHGKIEDYNLPQGLHWFG